MLKTLLLKGVTGVFMLFDGIPAEVFAASHRNSWIDRPAMTVSVGRFSLANFLR
jgi:ABC-type dipeptide/oligopeptide/nickel transport system permease component